MPPPLRLEVETFTDADHWRWVLKDADGGFIADQSVALDPNEQNYQGLVDLPGYLKRYALPPDEDADERRLVREVGAWIGQHVLGTNMVSALCDRANPTLTVRVILPESAARLLTLPLEIARLDAETLSEVGVGFVFEMAGRRAPAPEPIGERLRILALFSLPPVGSPLNLRRERQELRRLVHELTANGQRAIDLRVLQYGVTRALLGKVLEEGEGWDIIHFSGHGVPGSLILEKPDGAPDPLPAADLARLVRRAGSRLKLVTLSSCLSAAATIHQTLTWLGLSPEEAPRREAGERAPAATPIVARALTEALDCAVLAMRHAVEDEFAIHFSTGLYENLLGQGQSLPRATLTARRDAAGADGRRAGVLSATAPALFGTRAAELILSPPVGPAVPDLDARLDYVPRQPEHFVGRVAAMTRASAALAPESDRAGVLFHGMAGAGKTSCAVELIYHHESAGRFAHFVWFKAPEARSDIAPALLHFAQAMERTITGLAMVHVVDREAEFRAWLPRLVRVLERNSVLIVLDNLETLLAEDGQWRDRRWGWLMEALLTPGGLSRTVLTSRIVPANLPAATSVMRVHALPRDEALLLVRALPNLRALLDGKSAGTTREEGRALVGRLLRLVQGHPKLIELAEAQAAEPSQLAKRLAQTAAAPDSALDAFFRSGETAFEPARFMDELRGWTLGIAAGLPEPARLLFQFLCAIEEEDRIGPIIAMNWDDVWKRLGRAAPAPDSAILLTMLTAAALVEQQRTGPKELAYRVLIHPGVAEAARASADPDLQPAVDRELAATWATVQEQAQAAYGKDPDAGAMIIRAGLCAFSYLSRLGEWGNAWAMLARVVQLDQSPAVISSALPMIQRVADAAVGTDDELASRGLLARIYRYAGRSDDAEALLRQVIDAAAERKNYNTASAGSGDLANLLLVGGKPEAALEFAERAIIFARQARQGPWSQLSDEVSRLQILQQMGSNEEVLARVMQLSTEMERLPDPPQANDSSIRVWKVREGLLGTGRNAALQLRDWQQGLALNERVQASQMARAAGTREQALTRFNDYGPLLRLERYAEARAVLDACRAVFEAENDTDMLGKVYSALADLEDDLNNSHEARRFEETALRFTYRLIDPGSVAVSHFNLSNYLTRLRSDWRAVLGHRLAAAMIRIVTQDGRANKSREAVAGDLRNAGAEAEAALPADFAALCDAVERVEGVRFRELMARLVPDETALNTLLHDIIAKAKEAT